MILNMFLLLASAHSSVNNIIIYYHILSYFIRSSQRIDILILGYWYVPTIPEFCHLRLRDYGLLCLAPPCSLFVSISHFVHGRYAPGIVVCKDFFCNIHICCSVSFLQFPKVSPAPSSLSLLHHILSCPVLGAHLWSGLAAVRAH